MASWQSRSLVAGSAMLLVLLGSEGPVRAQAPGPLITDRPDRTESAAVVAPGFAQLETGWSYSVASTDGSTARVHALPEALLRIGIASRLEARVGFAGWMSLDIEGELPEAGSVAGRRRGVGDTELGLKLRLAEEGGMRPEIALLGGVTLPTGSTAFTSDRVDPAFRILLARGLGQRASLGVNVGARWASFMIADETATHADLLYTVTVALSLTDRLGAFAEGFGFFGLDDRIGDRHALDGGLTLLLADNFQLDASGGFGLSGEADSWFVGAGLSLRLPR